MSKVNSFFLFYILNYVKDNRFLLVVRAQKKSPSHVVALNGKIKTIAMRIGFSNIRGSPFCTCVEYFKFQNKEFT